MDNPITVVFNTVLWQDNKASYLCSNSEKKWLIKLFTGARKNFICAQLSIFIFVFIEHFTDACKCLGANSNLMGYKQKEKVRVGLFQLMQFPGDSGFA